MPAKSSTELFAAAPVTTMLLMCGAAMLRLPEFCYFVTFAVTWTLADVRWHTFDEAGAELRRLIRERFEHGIPGEQPAQAAGLPVPRVYQIRDGRR
jgi:hypothetical protein